jgi:hypothetical protein
MSIEAMKQALEALGSYMEATDSEADAEAHSLMAAAFFKLKEAVAEAEKQEPVAWADEIIEHLQALYNSEMITENDSGDALIRLDAAICAVEEAEQRHTTPPAAQRQPLTDEQIDAVCAPLGFAQLSPREVARAIEAAHGITGEKT